MHTAMAGSSSLKFQAFKEALPGLNDKLYTVFTILRNQCQGKCLLTEDEGKTQFGGRGTTPTDDTSTLLNIVLNNIKCDPSNFKKFMELEVVKSAKGTCKSTILASHMRSSCSA